MYPWRQKQLEWCKKMVNKDYRRSAVNLTLLFIKLVYNGLVSKKRQLFLLLFFFSFNKIIFFWLQRFGTVVFQLKWPLIGLSLWLEEPHMHSCLLCKSLFHTATKNIRHISSLFFCSFWPHVFSMKLKSFWYRILG